MAEKEAIESLRKEIKDKESQLYRAEREMHSWSSGKYKSHSNAQMSKIFIDSLRKDIKERYKQLRELENV